MSQLNTPFVLCTHCGKNITAYLSEHHQKHCSRSNQNHQITETSHESYSPAIFNSNDDSIDRRILMSYPEVHRIRGGCFIEGTQILLSNESNKSIENVEAGDNVKTYNMITNQIENQIVLDVLKYTSNELAVITLEDENQIICTVTHPIFLINKHKWGSVKLNSSNPKVVKLQIGDSAMNKTLQPLKIINVDFIRYSAPIPVYTLHIEQVHNFFANGILVHNAMQIFISVMNVEDIHNVPANTDEHMSISETVAKGFIRQRTDLHIPYAVTNLCLKYASSGYFGICVNPNETIQSVKTKIQEKIGVNVDKQVLVFSSKQLENNRTLYCYPIQKNSTLHLLLK